MKYLVTGGTGFVGAALMQRLYNDGHKVFALVRSSNGREADILDVVSQECFDAITFCYGDLNDYNSLFKIFDSNSIDGVFHLAAQSHPPTGFLDPIGTLQTNLLGSANLFDVVEKTHGLFCKICVVSTSEVYGNSGSDGRLLKESDPLAPSNPYATGKAAMDLHFQERMTNKKNSGFITRAFSHTGPRRGKTFSISSDAYQIAQFMRENDVDKTYQLRVGNLDTVRCVLDVADVCDAYAKLMYSRESNGRVFNVSGSEPKKMGFFTDKLIELSGLSINKTVDEKLYRPHDIHYQAGNVSALKDLTNWKPTIPIEQTLQSLLNYWVKKLS